ncbi:catalase, partial [Streptomyces sp. JV190]|uniref:catalase n=1 Tax=Streptomyces sp. JV190 TaxID=3002533 RepID=UPI003FA6E6E1
MLQAIARGVNPSRTLYLQVKPAPHAPHNPLNPFDHTNVWPHTDKPHQRVGPQVQEPNPDNLLPQDHQAPINPNKKHPPNRHNPEKNKHCPQLSKTHPP